MTEHRAEHTAPGDRIDVREVDMEDREGSWWAIRMPISSTAEARDGKAFTRERLDNWVRQIDEGTVPVFADHGRNDNLADSRYSAFGKLGFYQNAEVVTRDDVADLVADAVILDPGSVPEEAAQYRQHLAILRTQAEAGMPITASVGWKGEDADADLLEGSIVGIPSDARADATAGADAAAMARAVSAASSDFDVATFVRELTSDDGNVVEVGGEEIDLTPPDAVQTAATLGLAKDDELEPDCGTGAGRESARQIAGDDVTAERIADIAAYLTSHEEDVTADGPPSDWSDEEWEDCGNLQYALWGGTGTGTGLEWAQSKANEVAAAQDEELPYDRTTEDSMTDDTTDEPDEGTDRDDEQERMGAEEFRERMLEMQEQQTDMLREMKEEAMDGDDEDDEDDEDGENAVDEAGESEHDEEASEERTVTLDGEEKSVDEVRTIVSDLREQVGESEPEDPETQDRGTEDDEDEERDAESETSGFGMAARAED